MIHLEKKHLKRALITKIKLFIIKFLIIKIKQILIKFNRFLNISYISNL